MNLEYTFIYSACVKTIFLNKLHMFYNGKTAGVLHHKYTLNTNKQLSHSM